MSTLYIRTGTEFREATTEEITSHPAVTTHLSELETQRNPHSFHIRHLLVTYYRELRIKGQWLERAGFSIGARVNVRVFRKRLIIDVANEPTGTPPHYHRRTRPYAPLA